MTRFTDGNRTVEITIAEWKYGQWTPDWSADFFAVGGLPRNADGDAYVVDDIDYLIGYATDWKNGEGDFYGLDNDTAPEYKLVDVAEVL